MVEKLLTDSGAEVWSRVTMYEAVVQTVLLYGIDIWVVMGLMLTVLESFHHQLDKLIVENTAWSDGYGSWELQPAEEYLEVIGMWPIK